MKQTDPILAKALVSREAAAKEVADWDIFIARYRQLSAAAVRVDQDGQPVTILGSGRIHETEKVALAIIAEAGHPLPTRLLLSKLEERGINVGGKDPLSTLSARLSRSAALVGERGIGWKARHDQAAGPEIRRDEPAA